MTDFLTFRWWLWAEQKWWVGWWGNYCKGGTAIGKWRGETSLSWTCTCDRTV